MGRLTVGFLREICKGYEGWEPTVPWPGFLVEDARASGIRHAGTGLTISLVLGMDPDNSGRLVIRATAKRASGISAGIPEFVFNETDSDELRPMLQYMIVPLMALWGSDSAAAEPQMPKGYDEKMIGRIAEDARAAWSAEQVATWGNDRTREIGRDEVRHILMMAQQMGAYGPLDIVKQRPITAITDKETRFFVALAKQAAHRMSARVCDDLEGEPEAIFKTFTTEEKDAMTKGYHDWNGDPEEWEQGWWGFGAGMWLAYLAAKLAATETTDVHG